MIEVTITSRQKSLRLNRPDLRALTRHVLKKEGIQEAQISLALVDDALIAELNERYLRHAGPTDVLTFQFSQDKRPLAAEIVVSVETALRESRRRRLRPAEEIRLYVIHGLLHLCGHDDVTPAQRRRMNRRQRSLLQVWQNGRRRSAS
jgi:probable rRNA maturation factor